MALNIRSNEVTSLKICGITKTEQALEIASLGIDAIGVIGVKKSPRFTKENERRKLFNELALKHPSIERVWVIADFDDLEILKGINGNGVPSIVQLHGKESPQRCKELKSSFPKIKWWKALRIRNQNDLIFAKRYEESADAILIDAWNRNVLGGTGERVPIELLKTIDFALPWWLAGGVCSTWIKEALKKVKPYGVDASSKLESYPGIKDLNKVKSLINQVKF